MNLRQKAKRYKKLYEQTLYNHKALQEFQAEPLEHIVIQRLCVPEFPRSTYGIGWNEWEFRNELDKLPKALMEHVKYDEYLGQHRMRLDIWVRK